MSKWTHMICDDCWKSKHPDRVPHKLQPPYAEEGRCCWCGAQTTSGIYVREDPMNVPKHRVGDHDDE